MRYEITFTGPIDDGTGSPVTCPKCGRSTGHTVLGDGNNLKKVQIRCSGCSIFPFPPGVAARQRLLETVQNHPLHRTN